jgi:Asp-tRNA(Asn)/Glu-tRNA(Gln) amidotransferase A subunit family amidase
VNSDGSDADLKRVGERDVQLALTLRSSLTSDNPPARLRISLLLPHAWAELADSVGDAVDAVGNQLASLGAVVETVELPEELRRATDVHRVIMRFEIARSFAPLYEHHRQELSEALVATIEEGRSYDIDTYARAHTERHTIAAAVAQIFGRTDVIIAPAASGEAPRGLENTGDPACAAPWTMVGLPMVTVPAGTGADGMPIGASVIGPVGADRLVLSVANAVTDSHADKWTGLFTSQ